MSLLEKEFSDNGLSPKVALLNEILEVFLESNKKIKNDLLRYFKERAYTYGDSGIKSFKLQGWYGGESHPTLELVLVDGKIKFGRTAYGGLARLTDKHLDEGHPVRQELVIFFADPKKYINKKMASIQAEKV